MTTPVQPQLRNNVARVTLICAQMVAIIFAGVAGTASTAARFAVAAPSQVTGVVFEDYNANGVKDTTSSLSNDGTGVVGVAVDRGVGGVTVTAYDNTGAAVGTTTSVSPSGAYVLDVASAAGPYRIEFSGLPAGYQPSFHGPTGGADSNGTSVQFVKDGNTGNVNFGILRPDNYCQNNPTIVANCYRFGAANAGNTNESAIYRFPYSAGSDNILTTPPYDVPAPTQLATFGQVGSTFGLAYARNARRLYASAYFKKHAGFGPVQITHSIHPMMQARSMSSTRRRTRWLAHSPCQTPRRMRTTRPTTCATTSTHRGMRWARLH